MKVLVHECDPVKDNKRDLPVNAYIVTYEKEGAEKHDIVICTSTVEIFDHYYDLYKKGLKKWVQADGRVPTRQWNNLQEQKQEPTKPPKKGRR